MGPKSLTPLKRVMRPFTPNLRCCVATILFDDRLVRRRLLATWMLAAFEGTSSGGDLKDALTALRAPLPNADDLAADRKQPMTFFATRAMETALKERTHNLGWTLGSVIEDLLVKASRAVKPDGKRKRPRCRDIERVTMTCGMASRLIAIASWRGLLAPCR
jgi:hypothetical protein